MSQTSRKLAVVGAACAVVLSACGGSSSSELTKSQLAAKANAACASYAKAATAVSQPSDFTTNPAAAAAYLDKLRPLVAEEEKTMRSLKPDAADRALWDRFLAAGEHITALFNDATTKAHARDRAGLADLVQGVTYKQSTLDPVANQLGATECAK